MLVCQSRNIHSPSISLSGDAVGEFECRKLTKVLQCLYNNLASNVWFGKLVEFLSSKCFEESISR